MPLADVDRAHEHGLRPDLQTGHLFREVNDRIREVVGRFGDNQPGLYVCECDDSACVAPITMTVGEYDAARRRDPSCALLAHHPSGQMAGRTTRS